MRWFLTVFTGVLALGGPAQAQSTASLPSRGYVEAVAQSAFGNVTSQSYGGEVGVTVAPQVQLFVDAGQVRDASPSDLVPSAQVVAAFLSGAASNVKFAARQPVTFAVAGVRYVLLPGQAVEPYVLGGGGVAQIKKDVTFTVAGTDVTNTIQEYGVLLGTDLSGTVTKPMVTAGGGVTWPVWKRLLIDFQYRYGRVIAADDSFNVNRAGVGLGVRF